MWSPCRGRVGGLPTVRFSLCSLKHRDGPFCSVPLKKDNCACLGSLSNVLGSFETLHSFLWCLCGWKSACFPNELMWLEHLAPRKAPQEALTCKHTCPEAHMQVQAIRCERRLLSSVAFLAPATHWNICHCAKCRVDLKCVIHQLS